MTGIAAVTGATGFLGRATVAELAASGWQVRCLARSDPADAALAGLDIEVVHGSLEDPGALAALVRGTDVVIHLAGSIKGLREADFMRANVRGTQAVVDAIRRGTPDRTRLVHVSTLAAREPHLSAYAGSKRLSEDAVQGGLAPEAWTIVRPTAIYGPSDRETLALFSTVATGLFPRLAPPQARVTMLFSEDAARALDALAQAGSRVGGQIFELSDSRHEGYSWPELGRTAADAMGARVRTFGVPACLVRGAGSAAGAFARLRGKPSVFGPGKVREIRHPDWTSAAQANPPTDIWESRTNLKNGFEYTVDWYRHEGWLPHPH